MQRRSASCLPTRARFAVAAVLALAAAPASAGGETLYLVKIGGEPVGTAREAWSASAAGAVETRSDLELTLNRQGARVELSARATFVEGDGRLERASLASRFSQQTTRLEADVAGETLRLRNTSGAPGAAWSERSIPLPGPLLGPDAVRRLSRERLRLAGDEIAAWSFVPELAGVFRLRRRVLEPASDASPLRIEETLEGVPLRRTLWLGPDGDLLRQEEAGPFGPMELVRATAEEAAAARAGFGTLPPEMYQRTVARSPVRLPSPRSLERLRVALELRDPERGWPELAGDLQEVLERAPDRRVLEVRAGRAPRAAALRPVTAVTTAPELRPYLEGNAIVEAQDPEIQRLSAEIVGAETDSYRAALLLSAWVQREMRFDLGIAFAPASELARARRGTCVGYAVLLAALARAAGIPARFAMGYVYYLGIWGGHAWTEMWLGEEWVPFDAALYAPRPADAARFAFLRSSLADGLGVGVLAGVQLYGNLDLEVLAYETERGEQRPGPGARPYALAGATYHNPGLGLRLAAPRGFSVSALDRVWPDPTLLVLEDGAGARLELREEPRFPPLEVVAAVRQRLAGRGVDAPPGLGRAGGWPVWIAADGGERAAAAFADGATLYTLVAQGPDAPRLLRRVLRRLRWERPPSP
jgi:transglutaminase-like putative cysteine protease